MLKLVYYGLITPVALLTRLVGSDPLQLKRDRDIDSYWIVRGPAEPASQTMPLQR